MSRPYVCPLCNGAGYLRRVEYVNDGSFRLVDGNTVGEVCHACKGAGIVWSPDVDFEYAPGKGEVTCGGTNEATE